MFGITKYKKTLYNEAVIDTSTNTVIFPHSKNWKEFEEWKKDNPTEYLRITQNKNNKLLWNGGLPIKDKNTEVRYDEEGTLISLKKYIDGGYLCKEYHSNGDIKLESKTTEDNLVYEKEYHIGEEHPFRTIIIDEFGTKTESVYHSKNILRKKVLTVFPNKTISHFDTDGNLYKQIHKSNNKKIVRKYFKPPIDWNDESDIVQNLETELITNLSTNTTKFTEYFPNGKIRANGSLDKNGKMHGKWEWYSRHAKEGQVESIHNFRNGKLLKGSKLFMEDGGQFYENKSGNLI
tara:strand:+ start:501 stop:1373 length:873 start_codon:yes stop_codon:yes gene_type:complete